MMTHTRIQWLVVVSLISLVSDCSVGQEPRPQVEPLIEFDHFASAVGLSPRGDVVVAGATDGSLHFWDRATGNKLGTMRPYESAVLAIDVSSDGRQLAIADRSGRVVIADVLTSQQFAQMANAVPAQPTSIFATRDSKWVLTGDSSTYVRMWNAQTGAHVRDFRAGQGTVNSVGVLANSQTVLAATSDGFLRGWNLADGKVLGTLGVGPLSSLAIGSEDELVVGSNDGLLRRLSWPPPEVNNFTSHSQSVTEIVLSADQKYLVTGGLDGRVNLSNAADGKSVHAMAGHTGQVQSLTMQTGSNWIVAGNETGVMTFWNATVPQASDTYTGHKGAIPSLAAHPDRNLIASGGADGTIRIWHAPRPSLLFEGHEGTLTTIVASDDGSLLATSSADKSVRVWNAVDGKSTSTIPDVGHPIAGLAFENRTHLFAGDAQGRVHRLDIKTKQNTGSFRAHEKPITGVLFLAEKKLLVTTAGDGRLRTWDPAKAFEATEEEPVEPVIDVEADKSAVQTLSPSTDQSLLLTSGQDKVIRAWSLDGKPIRQFGGSAAPWRHVVTSPDNVLLAGGGDSLLAQKTVHVWKLATGQAVWNVPLPVAVSGVCFDRQGRLIVSTVDQRIRIFDVANKQLLGDFPSPDKLTRLLPGSDESTVYVAGANKSCYRVYLPFQRLLTGHKGAVNALEYSADGSRLFSAGADGAVRQWKLEADQSPDSKDWTGAGGAINSFSLHSDQVWAASAGANGVIHLLELSNDNPPKSVKQFKHPNAVRAVAFADRCLVAAGDDGVVRVWDIESGLEIERLHGHQGAILGLATTDSRRVFTAGADKTVRGWQRAVSAYALGHSDSVDQLTFTNEDHTILSCGLDGALKEWNPETLEPTQERTASPISGKRIVVSDNGHWAAALSKTGPPSLTVWATDGQASPHTEKLPAVSQDLTWSSDGTRVLVTGDDGVIRCFRVFAEDGKAVVQPWQKLTGPASPVLRLALSADQRTLFSVGADRVVRRWHAASTMPRLTHQAHEGPTLDVDFSADAQLVVSSGADGKVRLADLQTGNVKLCESHVGEVTKVQFQRKATEWVSCGQDGKICVWGLESATDEQVQDLMKVMLISEIEADVGPLSALTVSADGQRIMAVGRDAVWQAWEKSSGEIVSSSLGHNYLVSQLQVNPAGSRMASIDVSGKLFIWSVSNGQPAFHQQLPVLAAADLSYGADGTELFVAAGKNGVMRVTIPGGAR